MSKLESKRDEALQLVAQRYAVKTTPHLERLMAAGNSAVARQYRPDVRELETMPGEMIDPIGDAVHQPLAGIVHRYPDRVLLKLAHVCAVYCRYCFRREAVGPGGEMLKPAQREAALQYIRDHQEIWEVILTGGDPMVLSPRQLGETLDALCSIEHVQVVRFHSRVPVADPARITPQLCAALKRKKAVYVALHINHADEITPDVESAIERLRAADCGLLSQSVLLQGVNDDAASLENLFRRLVALRVKPYYLHHPDLAPGTRHFRLSLARGRGLMKQLLGRVSGLCMPHYMLDIPGGAGKVPVNGDYLRAGPDDCWHIEDFKGGIHSYRESL